MILARQVAVTEVAVAVGVSVVAAVTSAGVLLCIVCFLMAGIEANNLTTRLISNKCRLAKVVAFSCFAAVIGCC